MLYFLSTHKHSWKRIWKKRYSFMAIIRVKHFRFLHGSLLGTFFIFIVLIKYIYSDLTNRFRFFSIKSKYMPWMSKQWIFCFQSEESIKYKFKSNPSTIKIKLTNFLTQSATLHIHVSGHMHKTCKLPTLRLSKHIHVDTASRMHAQWLSTNFYLKFVVICPFVFWKVSFLLFSEHHLN